MVQSPPGWGHDGLSDFLEAVRTNQFATFHSKKAEYDALREVDDCFLRIGQHLVNPNGLIEALLLLRSHSAFRAACACAMAGQAAETYPLIRSELEYAGYALLVHKDHKLQEVWLRR